MRFLSVLIFAAAGPAAADIFPFKMPSGNIECTVGVGGGEVASDIQCAIFQREGATARPRPADCAGTWGHLFALSERGPMQMRCGAPGRPSTSPGIDVATYGETGRFGAITCQSSVEGLECRNGDGHGFFLSRRRQAAF